MRARAVHDRDGARSPTSCCRRRCSWSTTTSISGGGHQYIRLGPKLIDAAGRMPLQPRGDLRARGAARRASIAASTMSAARDHRLDAAELRAGARWRKLETQKLDRRAADVRDLALPRRLRLAGQKIPLQGRIGRACRSPTTGADGAYARPCRRLPDHWARDRGGGRGASVPAGDQPGAQFPQFELQRRRRRRGRAKERRRR